MLLCLIDRQIQKTSKSNVKKKYLTRGKIGKRHEVESTVDAYIPKYQVGISSEQATPCLYKMVLNFRRTMSKGNRQRKKRRMFLLCIDGGRHRFPELNGKPCKRLFFS